MAQKKSISYEQAGVSIDANDTMVERISRSVSSTHGPRVIGLENGFAGLFRLDYDEKLFKRNYKSPVLVACTDGVGTKVLIAQEMNRFETIGQDLVAMNVNDMLVQGAEPLFFLDYVGINKLDPEIMAQIVESIAKGCRMADCALIGGETAEMPDIYDKKGEYDLAGFAVGVVERHRIITGKHVQKGDVVLGLASSGIHSNGYTLVRHILFKQHSYKVTDRIDELGGDVLGEVLLEPTHIYVRSIVRLLSGYKRKQIVHGMAHITGGGLVGNIPRVLPDDCDAVLNKDAWPVPPIFRFLEKLGPVDEEEMFRVFNMGIGYVLIVAPDFAAAVKEKLEKSGQTVYQIGVIAPGNKKVVLK
jgi:phosphoribosylformylglycinamidine cyclo-ligase